MYKYVLGCTHGGSGPYFPLVWSKFLKPCQCPISLEDLGQEWNGAPMEVFVGLWWTGGGSRGPGAYETQDQTGAF